MEASEENPLEAAERQAREARQSSEEARQSREAEEAATGEAASDAAAQLISQCLERLAQAGWPEGETISALETVLEPVGLLRKQQERRRYVDHEVWIAPQGAGYRTGTMIGSMLNGEWAKLYRDSEIAVERDGTL